jgi:uncharacterized membrane protein
MTQTITLPPVEAASTVRISTIDVLRGLVMIIMALDHTRDFFHVNAFNYDPTDMATTTPPLFFTRWITHYCAPVFVFLAGTAAYLSGRRKSRRELSTFLFTRGLWLVVLELTVINFSMWFDPTFSFMVLQVIWAIGVSMVVLSGLVYLPWRWLLAIGLGIMAGHNAFDSVTFAEGTSAYYLWTLLHQSRMLSVGNMTLFALYPVLPWIGVMVTGYCFGRLYSSEVTPEQRKRWLLWLGGGAVVGFIVLRYLNVYGNLTPWEVQKDGLFTFMSFLNTTKYPPSLLYLLMTLGPGLLLLYVFERRPARWMNVVKVYGQVPLFYYILHFFLIHTLSVLSNLVIDAQRGAGAGPATPAEYGYSLGGVYVVWLVVVLALYPLCRWYAGFKKSRQSRIWSYL